MVRVRLTMEKTLVMKAVKMAVIMSHRMVGVRNGLRSDREPQSRSFGRSLKRSSSCVLSCRRRCVSSSHRSMTVSML